MRKLWQQWKRSSGPVNHIAEFQIDELPMVISGDLGTSEYWSQVHAICADLIRSAHLLRTINQKVAVLQHQAETAKKEKERLVDEIEQLRHRLELAQRLLPDKAKKTNQEHEALLRSFAIEVYSFQKTLLSFEAEGMVRQMGSEYKILQALKGRMSRLLHEEDVVILDPEGQAPNAKQVDVLTFVTRPDVEQEVIIETVHPIVMQGDRIIGRGKVVVAIPPEF